MRTPKSATGVTGSHYFLSRNMRNVSIINGTLLLLRSRQPGPGELAGSAKCATGVTDFDQSDPESSNSVTPIAVFEIPTAQFWPGPGGPWRFFKKCNRYQGILSILVDMG